MIQAHSDGGAIATTGLMPGISSEQPPELWWGPLVLTPEKLEAIWEQSKGIKLLFDDYTRGNFDDFANKFFNPRNVFVDIGPGIGLAAGFAVKPGLDAVLHLIMFDRRLRGRDALFTEIMSYFFKLFHLKRMTSLIASDATVAVKLAERLGFKKEGTMRHALLRDGRILDVHIYGILAEECVGKH